MLSQLSILQPSFRVKKMTKVVQHPYPLSMNTHDIPGGHFHTDIEYGFITTEDPSLSIAKNESADLRWVTRSELDGLGSDLIFDNTREIYKFAFDEALISWEQQDANDFLLNYPKDYIE